MSAGDSLPKTIRAPPPAAAPIVKPMRMRTCSGRRPGCAASSVLSSRSEMTSCSSGCIRTGRALSLLKRLPVLDDGDGRRAGVFLNGVHEKPLSIGRDDILLPQNTGSGADVRCEQRNWGSSRNRLMLGVERDWHSHQAIVQRNVEQLFAAARPTHLCAATARNGVLRSRTGKRLDVHFEPAGLVRLVRDPFAVWRELSVALVGVRLDDNERL